jgi:hypothetical protein
MTASFTTQKELNKLPEERPLLRFKEIMPADLDTGLTTLAVIDFMTAKSQKLAHQFLTR